MPQPADPWSISKDDAYAGPSASQRSSTSRALYGGDHVKVDNNDDSIQASIETPYESIDAGQRMMRKRQLEMLQGTRREFPTKKAFLIQVGSEVFHLSGASIMSDGLYCFLSVITDNETDCFRAPSYFSKFFEDQIRNTENGDGGIKPLFIDRDPVTFQDIARHLQGK
jgi:hypothetical protein